MRTCPKCKKELVTDDGYCAGWCREMVMMPLRVKAPPAVAGAAICSAASRLQQVLTGWRAAEREHARAVLCAANPDKIKELADAHERALHHVRLVVDGEPWADLTGGY